MCVHYEDSTEDSLHALALGLTRPQVQHKVRLNPEDGYATSFEDRWESEAIKDSGSNMVG